MAEISLSLDWKTIGLFEPTCTSYIGDHLVNRKTQAILSSYLAEPQRTRALEVALDAALSLPVVSGSGERSPRAEVLVALATYSTDEISPSFKKALVRTIRDYARVRRPDVLADLVALAQKVPIFHQPKVAEETHTAIEDVASWWP